MRIKDLGPNPNPEDLTATLLDIESEVRAWQSWHSTNGAPSVKEGSSLWSDDVLSAPYQCSHLILHYLYVATDTLDALLRMTLDRSDEQRVTLTTRPHGQVPMLRSALECSCVAIFLLGDQSAEARIKSRLQLAFDDIERHARTQKLAIKDLKRLGHAASATSNQVDEAKRQARKTLMAVGRKFSLTRSVLDECPSMAHMVGRAGYLSGAGTEHLGFIWNVLAGASHGSHWASRDLLQYDILDEDSESDLVTVNVTLPPWVLAYLVDEIHWLLHHAWSRWTVRCDRNAGDIEYLPRP